VELSALIESSSYQSEGWTRTSIDSFHVVAIDQSRHPLQVWTTGHSWVPLRYVRAAKKSGGLVTTNGPMMGKLNRRGKRVGRLRIIATGGLAVATAGAVAATTRSVGRGLLVGAVGTTVAWFRSFGGWIPCGFVQSSSNNIDDRSDFRNEGPTFGWIGRRAGSPVPVIGRGQLPEDITDGMGGLLLLMADGVPIRAGTQDVFTANIARLGDKRGVVAWATTETGAVVVVGSASHDVHGATELLLSLGARDAIATDQKRCVVLIVDGTMLVGPPPPARQQLQRYGLSCGTGLYVAGSPTKPPR
jgi:hypothetical protein